jgi:hypothetical protein
MAESSKYLSDRISARADEISRDIAEIDTSQGTKAALDAHLKAIQLLLELVGMLGAEVDQLRHDVEHPR